MKRLFLLAFLALPLIAPTTADAGPKGKGLKQKKKKKKKKEHIRSFAQVQMWTTAWDQDQSLQAEPASYGDPEADPGFSLPRARFGVYGDTYDVDFRVSAGIGTPYDALTPADDDLQIVDAYARWGKKSAIGPASLTAGIQKVPISRELLMSSQDLVFQERAVSSEWLAPGRDVGVTGSQAWKLEEGKDAPRLILRLGGYNGNGAFQGDDDPGLLLAARLEFLMGNAYKTWSRNLKNALGVGISAGSNTELATTTQIFGGDFLARVGRFTLLVEGLRNQIVPTNTVVTIPSVRADTIQFGGILQGSLWITAPKKGGIEAAVRIATFDDALHLDDNGDVAILHGGLNWRDISPGVDLGAGMIHRMEREGRAVPNDTLRIWAQLRYPTNTPKPKKRKGKKKG